MTTKPQTWDDALRKLAKPVPQKFVKQKPDRSRADYVPHHIIRQYLHALFDAHVFDPLQVWEERETRYFTVEKKGNKTVRVATTPENAHIAADVVTKVRVEVRGEFRVGDETRVFTDFGESENEKAPFKSAVSDAVKRIAANGLGFGLHLWSREHYFLPKALQNQADAAEAAAEVAERDAEYGNDGDEPEDDDTPPGAEPAPDVEEAKSRVEGELGGEEIEEDPEEAPRTQEQNKRLHALKRELNISSRKWQNRLSQLYGVTSSKNLTKAQASELIDRLEGAKDQAS